jgi:predicted O-methyltransferase YrrM
VNSTHTTEPSGRRSLTSTELLAQIYTTQTVCDQGRSVPLHSHMSESDGRFIQDVIKTVGATNTLEVGMAYGISTLFICEALESRSSNPHHIAVDPFQHSDWRGIGLGHVELAGFSPMVEFIEERSEFVLPRLLSNDCAIDVALIDGWHSFDQALLEFYYIDRMLRIGGAVIFDDADWPSQRKLLQYLASYPNYEVIRRQPPLMPSLLGRIRKQAVKIPVVAQMLNPSIRRPAWDLGLQYRCVALRKTADDRRDMKWFEDF